MFGWHLHFKRWVCRLHAPEYYDCLLEAIANLLTENALTPRFGAEMRALATVVSPSHVLMSSSWDQKARWNLASDRQFETIGCRRNILNHEEQANEILRSKEILIADKVLKS
jgi:hypothetical protein